MEVQLCIEVPKVFKLRSQDYLNVKLLVKLFLYIFRASVHDALIIPFDIIEFNLLIKPFEIVNEIDLNVVNINFWIVEHQHTIQETK